MNHVPNKKTHDLTTLAGRLAYCTELAGGKRAMSAKTDISEAQLFRYINGDADKLSAGKLEAVAQAVGVDIMWLLTGKENGQRQTVFLPEFMTEIVQSFEETLLDHPVRFTPKQKAKAISLIYHAVIQEVEALHLTPLDKGMMLDIIEFLSPMRATDEIGVYHKLCLQLQSKQTLSSQEAQVFERLTTLGVTTNYDGLSGQMYYDRMGYSLSTQAAHKLLKFVTMAGQMIKNPNPFWLDIACGNGRHLSFLHQHSPHLQLHGVDNSALAQRSIESLSRAGKLPTNTFTQADARQLPYASNTMDIVYCRQGLFELPWLEGHDIGMVRAVHEMTRVLKPGGLVNITLCYGQNTHWLTFLQQYNEQTITKIFTKDTYELINFEKNASASENGGVIGKDYNSRYGHVFNAIFRKKDK